MPLLASEFPAEPACAGEAGLQAPVLFLAVQQTHRGELPKRAGVFLALAFLLVTVLL